MYAETDGLKKKLYSKQNKQAKMAIDSLADNKVENTTIIAPRSS